MAIFLYILMLMRKSKELSELTLAQLKKKIMKRRWKKRLISELENADITEKFENVAEKEREDEIVRKFVENERTDRVIAAYDYIISCYLLKKDKRIKTSDFMRALELYFTRSHPVQANIVPIPHTNYKVQIISYMDIAPSPPTPTKIIQSSTNQAEKPILTLDIKTPEKP